LAERSSEELRRLMQIDTLPRSGRYDPAWVLAHAMGSQTLWLAEALCQKMALSPGMRVLDLGCGKAIDAIFLAREYGVTVWAVDPRISPRENWDRIREAQVERLVIPLQADAHALPFAEGYFDALFTVNSYQFFGTDDTYLGHYVKLVRPGGLVAMIVPGLLQDWGDPPPEHVRPYWVPDMLAWHTLPWWTRHWERTGLVDILAADALEDVGGWTLWLRWQEIVGREGLIRDDAGRYITFLRVVAQRRTPGK
jgi:SAM-dependent methyltransferase